MHTPILLLVSLLCIVEVQAQVGTTLLAPTIGWQTSAITHVLSANNDADVVYRSLRATLLEHSQQTLRAYTQLNRLIPTPIVTVLDATPDLSAARIELQRGDYDIVQSRIRIYLSARPPLPFRAEAYYILAVAEFQRQRYRHAGLLFDSAAIEAEQLVARDRTYELLRSTAVYWKAVAYFHHTSFALAADAFRQLLTFDSPYTDDAYAGLATIAEFNGEYQRALFLYDSVLIIAPRGSLAALAHIRAAQQLILLRQPRQALQRLAAAQQLIESWRKADPTLEAQTLPPHTEQLVELLSAEALNQLGQFDRAAERYRIITAHHDSDWALLQWQAYLGLGWAKLNQARYSEALAAYRTVIDSVADVLSPQKAQAVLFSAIATKRSGDVLGAIEQLDAMIVQESFPLRAQALLERGQIEYERNQFTTAGSLFERAYRSASDPATLLRGLLLAARAQFDQQRWSNAVRLCSDVLSHAHRFSATLVPNLELISAEALRLRGIAFCNDGRYAESIADLGQFIERYKLNPRRDEALLWLADSYERLNMVEQAAITLEQLLALYPNSFYREDALYNLGWTQFRLRRFEDATTTFDRLLSEFPRSRYALDVTLRKADMLYLVKKYADAARYYRQVVKMTPHSDDGEYALYQVGQSLYRLGDYTNAAEQFRSFVRSFPESSIADDALYNIAWIRMLQGKWSDAITAFEALLRSYPQSELVQPAKFYIAQCTYNGGQYVRAIELYRQFLSEYPHSGFAGRAIEAIQDAYINLGQDSLAVAVAREFVERDPASEQSAQVMLRTTDIFVRNRDYANALRQYEEFLQRYPDSRYVTEALYGMLKSALALDDQAQALAVLNRLEQKYPNDDNTEMALSDVAVFFAQRAFTARADSLFRVVMERYPASDNYARAAYERARIALARGDTALAVTLWGSAKAAKGEYAYQASYRLGMWYRQRNLSDSARAMFRPIVDYTDNLPLAAEAAYRIAELWQRDGNCIAAQDTYALVLDRFEGIEDWYTLALLGAAECAETLGNTAKARELYQTVMILRPDDDFGRTAAARRRRLDKAR
ncbi:MAG: tetratricopeptide repeat protein [Chlorobi bacterium]|nr:tetratricopeptide repeat protein [Chlorobiota bacterium]